MYKILRLFTFEDLRKSSEVENDFQFPIGLRNMVNYAT